MSNFSTLSELATLCESQHAADTANHRTFTILVIHPDCPEPLLQPIGVDLVVGLPVPVGQGAWLMSLNKIMKGSMYLPANMTTGLITFIQASKVNPAENMAVLTQRHAPKVSVPDTVPLTQSLSHWMGTENCVT
ncbi:hypothetical protein GYMLUDRAFT_63274 [Collybiopsis luxurians FD-317 M1]|uniref:Uncharacterized protein n=1 Tax=Collybiopsis luxurians FD-317 M1 TaxID=944289 RepID=A0A0D0AUW5_9AGAR|nr:hypothetical protein GYMLUDRAFT_63274 [Collybiopsis luxurians FD-317 M1]